MENMETYETYVSPETAKLLKQAGFDWEEHYPRSYCYVNDIKELYHKPIAEKYFMEDDVFYLAPIQEVAERWLREVKGYYITLEFDMNIGFAGQELYDFNKISVYVFAHTKYGNICKCKLEEEYKTYEEAQEAGIKKALEIILKN